MRLTILCLLVSHHYFLLLRSIVGITHTAMATTHTAMATDHMVIHTTAATPLPHHMVHLHHMTHLHHMGHLRAISIKL